MSPRLDYPTGSTEGYNTCPPDTPQSSLYSPSPAPTTFWRHPLIDKYEDYDRVVKSEDPDSDIGSVPSILNLGTFEYTASDGPRFYRTIIA